MLKKGLTIIFIILAFVVLPSVVETSNNNYVRTGVVVSAEAGEVEIQDTTGNIWVYDEVGFSVGDKVELKMFNNHTLNNIQDDEIKIKEIKKIVEKG